MQPVVSCKRQIRSDHAVEKNISSIHLSIHIYIFIYIYIYIYQSFWIDFLKEKKALNKMHCQWTFSQS